MTTTTSTSATSNGDTVEHDDKKDTLNDHDNDDDDDDDNYHVQFVQTLLTVNEVFVYRIAPMKTSGGHRCVCVTL